MAQIDFSLQNRIPDGNGKLLVGDLSPTDGSYTTEQQYLEWMKGKILYSGYLYNGDFYKESAHTNVISKVDGAIYVDLSDGTNLSLYYCDNTTYKPLTEEAQVQAIIDGLNDGTIVPLKAKQDQNGNVIDQTYETKADASDLKSAIQGNSQRIENLEVAVSGSLVQTNTDATMANTKVITNANEILPWAILKRVGARAVSWNQLAKPIEASRWASSYGSGLSFSDGVGTQVITQAYQYSRCTIPLIAGHKYLIHGYVAHDNDVGIGLGDGPTFYQQGIITTKSGDSHGTFEEFSAMGTWVSSYEKFFIIMAMNNSVTQIKFKECVCFDMTAMGLANLTKAEFQALFPASYYPYNAGGIIPLNPSAFKVVGKQKWDEVWSAKEVDASTGLQSNTTNTRISNDNLIPVFGGEVIYLLSPADVTIYGFDAEGNYIGYANINTDTIGGGYFKKNQAYTVPARMAGFRFMTYSTYGNVYNHDIMCCLNSVTDKTYEEYKETTILTPQIADGHYVNENCYDYVENVTEDGIVKGKFHDVADAIDLSTINLSYTTNSNNYPIFVSDDALPRVLGGKEVMTVGGGFSIVNGGRNSINSDKQFSMHSASNGKIAFSFTGKTGSDLVDGKATWLSGVMLYFKKATESVTDCEPIPNLPVEDGTTVQAVTPQTDLVNSIDVPSTIAYMTKIGG